MLTKIESKSHPTHYLMHKYWGRKAHNLVAEYLKHYTKKGDIVLDPFMGSGGVVIESKKIGRRSIGIDINPITKLIVDNTLNQIDPEEFKTEATKLLDKIPLEVQRLSTTVCPTCNEKSALLNAVWKKNVILRVKGKCSVHGQFTKNADEYDLNMVKKAAILLRKYSTKHEVYYPKDRILDFVRRNGKKQIDELFSSRNLLQSAILLKTINEIKDPKLRNLCQLAFTSMLPNVSGMIPADAEKITGKSGWQISKFWVPSLHTEKNVTESFISRVRTIYKGKLETKGSFSAAPHKIYVKSSENMAFLENNSIDYIFTDPPYGDSIAYLALSMFWNSWLGYKVNYEGEIIHDPYRKKGYQDYEARLSNVFNELFRVLKPGKNLSFTFHNRYIKYWKIVIGAVLESGFELKDINWHPQAVSSGTQGLNRKNTLKGDFVYTFVKPTRGSYKLDLPDVPGELLLANEVEKLFKEYKFIETAKLYEKVIPVIVRNRAFIDNQGKVLDIDKLLAKKFYYSKIKYENGWRYGWSKEKIHNN